MSLDRIKRWMDSHGIKTNVTPSLSLFGLISFSLISTDIYPALLGGDYKNSIPEFIRENEEFFTSFIQKTVKISSEEFRKLLQEELKGKDDEAVTIDIKAVHKYLEKEEGIEKLLREIKQAIQKSPTYTIEEFELLFNKQMPVEYEFVGREEELERLSEFLNTKDEAIRLIIGEGGTGKTRLALEFAKKVEKEGGWDVYFVHPDNEFIMPLLEKNTLFILDEPSRYRYREKLIREIVRHPHSDVYIKLLLLDRPILGDLILSNIREIGPFVQPLMLGKGDLTGFLRRNFSGLNNVTIEGIIRVCDDNFVYGAYFAEYYGEKGKIGTLRDVLAHKVEKYIKDLCESTGRNYSDIKTVLSIISLIMPIEWESDRECLFKELPRTLCDIFEDIKGRVDVGKTRLIRYVDKKYFIKPDPVADYIRMEVLKDDSAFQHWLDRLLPFMPLRISYNIFVLPRFTGWMVERVFANLGNVWQRLNADGGETPEFFYAIVLFTGNMSRLPFFDIEKAQTNVWFGTYCKISKTYPESMIETSRRLAAGLYNTAICYSEHSKHDSMERVLGELRELARTNEDPEISEWLAKGVVNAINDHVDKKDIEKIESSLDELRAVTRIYDEERIRARLAEGLVNAMGGYGIEADFEKIELFLAELTALEHTHNGKEIRVSLAIGLYNAVHSYGAKGYHEKMEQCLYQLRIIARTHDDPQIRGSLAMGLVSATSSYSRAGDLNVMEERVDELRGLARVHDERMIRKALANGFYNAASSYGRAGDLNVMERRLDELRELAHAHDEQEIREELVKGLFNAVIFYTIADQKEFEQIRLDEIEALRRNHQEDASIAKVIEELRNALREIGKKKKNK